ncbi:MAG: SPFH domain-containing protein [Clostridiales bacterium]|nr:SPFH domain-containing protein [Clostridiales bacterium]
MNENKLNFSEKRLKAAPGIPLLILNILVTLAGVVLFVFSAVWLATGQDGKGAAGMIVSVLAAFIVCPIIFGGFKSVRPNEAIVLTLFGKYYGTLRNAGFFFVNPFSAAVAPPPAGAVMSTSTLGEAGGNADASKANTSKVGSKGGNRKPLKKLSMKTMTLNNDRQKINDKLGNPIEIGIVVIWRVVDTVEAMFNVDDYVEFLSIQCDSSLRSIVRLYPYDTTDEGDETQGSLRGSSQEICVRLQEEIQSKVAVAGLEIIEARITHLAYSPEIAAVMLQRQQANAIIDARKLIVEGAVGMVEMALEKLNERSVVQLDEERKAAMVSNLLVVLCGNRDAQPIVNSGSLY